MQETIASSTNPFSKQFPIDIDPFAPLFTLSVPEIQARSNYSRTDGYAPFKAAILPISTTEIEEIQQVVKPYLEEQESIITIEDPDIKPVEKQFFQHLYQSVYHQNWIRLVGDETFVNTCKMAIITLLQVDVGRSLLLTAYRSHQLFIIQQAATAHVGSRDEDISLSDLHIFMPLHTIYYPAIAEDGETYIETLPFFITLGHELLHCLQKISLQARSITFKEGGDNIKKLFSDCETTDPLFPNTLERLTILGIDNLIPSENALHYAFGTNRCCSYFSTGFPAANSEAIVRPDEKVRDHTRIERAAYFGFGGEVNRLIRFGYDPTEALYGTLHYPSKNKSLITRLSEHPSVNIQKQLPYQNSTVIKYATDLFNQQKLSSVLYHTILANLFVEPPRPIATRQPDQQATPQITAIQSSSRDNPRIVVVVKESTRAPTETDFSRGCKIFQKWLESAFTKPSV